jgi:hypothetical protein
LTRLNIAVFAPTPNASETIAIAVKPGLFASRLSPNLRSCNNVSIDPSELTVAVKSYTRRTVLIASSSLRVLVVGSWSAALTTKTRRHQETRGTASGTQRLDRDNLDLKINWNRRDTHTIRGKYSIMNANVGCDPALGAAGGAPLCQGNIGNGELRTQVATIGHTMTFSPTFLWDGAIGWTRQGQEITGFRFGEFVGREVLGIPGTNGNGTDVRESGVPVFDIPGYTRLGSDTDTRPFLAHDTSFTLQQNFSWNRSRHQLRFGFEGVRHHLNHYSPDAPAMVSGARKGSQHFFQSSCLGGWFCSAALTAKTGRTSRQANPCGRIQLGRSSTAAHGAGDRDVAQLFTRSY